MNISFYSDEEHRRLLSAGSVFIFGGPRSGKTTLIQELLDCAVSNFNNQRQVVSLVSIRPYWNEPEEIRNRISAAIIDGLLMYVNKVRSAKVNSMDFQLPVDISIKTIAETAKRDGIDPLRWALQKLQKVSTDNDCTPLLFFDDSDFLLISGILSEILHLCEVHEIGTIFDGRSFCSSEFDSANTLAEYTRGAELICLDFLPTDLGYQNICKNILEQYVNNNDGELKKVAQRVQVDPELYRQLMMLSGGQIGRFQESIRFLATCQDNRENWYKPTRKEIGDFCESVVTQMLQREQKAILADNIKKWLKNIRTIVGSKLEYNVNSTWITLPISDMDSNLLSTVRAGVLSWIFQCESQDRINTGKQSRFVPERIRLSSMAAIASELPLKIAIG